MDSNISSISLEQNIEVFSEEWLANRKNWDQAATVIRTIMLNGQINGMKIIVLICKTNHASPWVMQFKSSYMQVCASSFNSHFGLIKSPVASIAPKVILVPDPASRVRASWMKSQVATEVLTQAEWGRFCILQVSISSPPAQATNMTGTIKTSAQAAQVMRPAGPVYSVRVVCTNASGYSPKPCAVEIRLGAQRATPAGVWGRRDLADSTSHDSITNFQTWP